jgi:hypothetical protein
MTTPPKVHAPRFPLLTSFLAIVGATLAATAPAQSAQSYTNAIPSGMSLIANQLDHGSNSLFDLFPPPTLPDGVYVTVYSQTNCAPSTYYYESDFVGDGWATDATDSTPVDPRTVHLPPGTAFFINNTASAFSLAFTGTPHVSVLPAMLPCGYGQTNYLSRQTNDVGDYANVTGVQPQNGAQVQQWTGSSFSVYTYTNGLWLPTNPPPLAIGQGAAIVVPAPRPPTISQPPASLTVTQGQSATFSVVAGGDVPLSYQWIFCPTPNWNFATNLPGKTNSSLALTNVQPANAGSYLVIISNAFGSITSSPALLSVVPQTLSYTITLPGGGNGNFYLIANQLDHGSNRLAELLPNMPDGSQVLKWNCSLQDIDPIVATYSASSHLWDTNLILRPGEGAFFAPGDTLNSITFTGTPHVPVLPAAFPCGNGAATMLSRQTNDVGNFQNITGLSPTDGALMQLWDVTMQDFQVYAFYGGIWYPSVPSVDVGGAALITLPGGATNSCLGLQCPGDIVVQSSTNVAINYSATASNVCGQGAPINITFYPPSGTVFTPGTTTRVVCVAYQNVGHASSCAFNVTVAPPSQSYSINIEPGLNLIANQLDHGSNCVINQLDHGSNCLNAVLSSIPDGCVLFKYDNASGAWFQSSYSALSQSWTPNLTLSPGEGAFLQSPTNFTLTFTGTPHVPVLPVNIPSGTTYLLSRQTNDVGDFNSILGLPPTDGATLFQWNGSNYNTYAFSAGSWTPSTPVVSVGEAVWINLTTNRPPPPIPLFYAVNILPGYNLIANQLDHGSNSVADVLGAVPDGCALYKYDNVTSNWVASYYSAASSSWLPPNLTLSPGEGAFLQSPTSFTLTLIGTPHVPVLPVNVPSGATYLLSRQTNDVGDYSNIVGGTPANLTKWYRFDAASQSYTVYTYSSHSGAWSPTEPNASVGEAVWIAAPGGSGPPPISVSYAISIQAGYNLIANQLDHGSNSVFGQLDHGSNCLNVVLPNVPDGCLLFKYDNASATWGQASFSAASNSWTPNLTLNPGEGAFLHSPTNFTLTFTGTPHVPVLPVNIPSGATYLLSRQTNDIGTYENIVGANPSAGATVYKWNGSNYTSYIFDDVALAWSPATPTADVGEAIWVSISGGASPPPLPIGELHNRGLDYLAAHNPVGPGPTRLTFEKLTDLIGAASNYLVSASFSSSDIADATAAYLQANTNLNMFYSEAGQVYYGSPVPSDQWPAYAISNLVAQGAMSTRLGAELTGIYNLVTNGTDPAAVLAYVSGTLPYHTNWTVVEQGQISSFVSIYQASDHYWQTHTNYLPPFLGIHFKWKWSWHDFADAVGGGVGGLLGSGGGPLGSAAGGVIGAVLISSFVQDADKVAATPVPGVTFHQPANPLTFNALPNQRLAAAALDLQVGNLVCEPLSNGVPFGLSAPLSLSQGFEAHWLPLDPSNSLPVGAYVNSAIYGTAGSVTNGLLGSWQFTKTAPSNYLVTADFSLLHVSAVTLQLYNGTTLVAQTNGQSGALCVLNGGYGCVADDHWGNPLPPGPLGPRPLGGSLTLFGPGNGPAPAVNVTFQGGWTVQGDRLVILPEGAPPVTSLSSAQLLAGGIPQILITDENANLGYAGMNVSSAGNAILFSQSNHLSLTGIGSSGQDGARISLPAGVDQWAAEWEPLDPTPSSVPTGAYLKVQLVGTSSTITNGILATISATKTTSNVVVTADFSAEGATNLTVQVYNGPMLAGQVQGLAMGIVYSDDPLPLPNLPCDCSACASYGCITFDYTYCNVQTFTFPGGAGLSGDRVLIIPQGPPMQGFVSSVLLEASQIPSLTITNEVVSPLLLNSTFDRNNLNLEWFGTGLLQESTNLTIWTDLPNALSPYIAPIASPNRFYRVKQNMGGESF